MKTKRLTAKQREDRRKPGGYIGEALRDAKRVRKPNKITFDGIRAAECFVWAGNRETDIYVINNCNSKDARRLAAWLIKAAEWMEDGNRRQ